MPMDTSPLVPELGLPDGTKEAGQRVDFKPNKFELAIETKGYLLAWQRACICPCSPVDDKTEQPDPNCSLCNGDGWFYFGGNVSQDFSGSDWDLDEVQQAIITNNSAMVIHGIVSGIQAQYNPWDKLGNWQAGTMQVTVRHENRIGYWDKLIALDSEIVYSEVKVADGSDFLETRYLVTGVNQIRSPTQTYEADVDYKLSLDGRIEWFSGKAPATGTRLALHYLCHPTFVVIEHPHVMRTTSVKFKTPSPKTPLGDPRKLPIQAIVKYEFLP